MVKVGGSLLSDFTSYDNVANIFARMLRTRSMRIVISAASGVTEWILRMNARQDSSHLTRLLSLHEENSGGSLSIEVRDDFKAACKSWLDGSPEPLLAWAERASAFNIQGRLARLGHTLPIVEMEWDRLPRSDSSAIVPSFYVRGPNDRIRILPRGGGDLSAVLVAAGIGVTSARLWKHGGGLWVDGNPVTQIEYEDIVPLLSPSKRPLQLQLGAFRLASQLGIGLRIEDPYGVGHSTWVWSKPESRRFTGRVHTPSELLLEPASFGSPVVR